jgi:hypothetical protein
VPNGYSASKMNFVSHSRSKVRCQGVSLAPFGLDPAFFTKSRPEAYPAVIYEVRPYGFMNSSLARSHFGTSRVDQAFSQKLVPRPTRPSNMPFQSQVIQKLLAGVSIGHFSVRPGVSSPSKATRPSNSSRSKSPSQGHTLALFGSTRRFLEASCQGLLALKYELRS